MEWKKCPAQKNREGKPIVTPLSLSGDYVISHRPGMYTVSYRPRGQHHHVGTGRTLKQAKALAETHSKGPGLRELKELARMILKRHDTGIKDYDADAYRLARGVLGLENKSRE